MLMCVHACTSWAGMQAHDDDVHVPVGLYIHTKEYILIYVDTRTD